MHDKPIAIAARKFNHPFRLGALAAIILVAAAACSSPETRVERYTASGLEYLEKGDLGRANVQFQNALKIDEEHVPALIGVAQLLEERQDFQSMFGVLQRIVRLDATNVDAHVKLGKLFLISGDESSSLEAAEKALALSPDNADAIAVKAAVLLKLDDEAGAVELAKKALELDPENTEAVAVLATERAQAQDFEGSLAVVDEGLAMNKDAPVLHLLRLQLLKNLGRDDEVLAGHRELIEIYPDNVSFRQLYVATLMRDENYEEAKTQLEQIVRLSPGDIDPILDVVRINYRLNGAEGAKATFAKYVEEQPDNIELKFQFGNYLRQEKDLKGAEAIYNSLAAIKSDPGIVARARNEIAGVRLLEGDREGTKAIVDEILAKDERNTDALIKRAGLKIDAEDYDGAITDLRSVLDDRPDSPAAKSLMASAFEKKGDIEFATTQFAQAVADSKADPRTSRLFVRFLLRHNDVARAEQVLLDTIAAYPRNVENLRLLAAVRLAQQNWRGAEETAQMIENVKSDDLIINRILGAARTGLEDYSGAIEALSAANEEAPLDARPLSTLVSAYIKEGRAEEAEELLRGMIEADEANYAARILLARVLQAGEKPDEMEAVLKAAVVAEPTRTEAVDALYRYYRGSGRDEDAAGVLNEALVAAPDSDALKVLRADLYLSTGRRAEALPIYEDILSRRPQDLLISNNYASLLLEEHDDPESHAKALQVAGALEGNENPYFMDTLGWARYMNGDYEGAVEALEKAAESAPDFAEVSYHLGAAYIAAGDVEKGRARLEKALGDNLGEPNAQKARDLLAQN